MAKKIKRKPEKNEGNNSFRIIILVTGIILGVIAVGLIVLAIIQYSSGSGQTEQSSQPSRQSSQTSDQGVSAVSEDVSTEALDSSIPEFLQSVEIDPEKDYYATIDVKDYGTIKVKLDPEAAPITVRNFIYLANSGFYNGLTFHRIMEDFMIQGGDPLGTGQGGSENNIYGEFSANGFDNPISHTRGTISMARNKINMNSASSQFFIVQSDKHITSLDGNYAAFGKVVDGIEIVDKIAEDAEPTDNNGTIEKSAQPVINLVYIATEDKAE